MSTADNLLREKELDDASHLEGAALDFCMCGVCLAVRRVVVRVLTQAAAELCERCRSGMPVNAAWFHDKCNAVEVLEMRTLYEQRVGAINDVLRLLEVRDE